MGPGLKYDIGKLQWDILPIDCVEDVVKILTFGAEKYGANNWQNVENGEDRYYAALMRHLAASRQGEKTDPESGLSHLAHVACNVVFLMWLEKNRLEKVQIAGHDVDVSKMRCGELECSKD